MPAAAVGFVRLKALAMRWELCCYTTRRLDLARPHIPLRLMIESHRQTLYAILGLAHDATSIEIERAVLLHKRVLQRHPHADRQREHLRMVEEARVVLLDPRRRAQYDRQLLAASSVIPGGNAQSRIASWLAWTIVACFVAGLVWVTYRAQSETMDPAPTVSTPPRKGSGTPAGARTLAEGRGQLSGERSPDAVGQSQAPHRLAQGQ